ncbi:MAG: hypothetical protein KY475_27450 [Planctomycetes bacterium]|nr:hypothetical protein [Planctomycetota bacterium]
MIVGGSEKPAPGFDVAPTAADAFRQLHANRWPEVQTLELRFSGPQAIAPLALARSLTIRAAEDYTPVLVFAEESQDSLHPRYHMISVAGGELTLEGVQVQWRLPSKPASFPWAPDEWSLFELDDESRLTLHRCALTIQNVDLNSSPQHNGAAFIRLASSLAKRTTMAAPEPPRITLSQCVLRGEADVVAADDGQPFRLSWSEGLLATSEHLADVGGAAVAPEDAISLDLDHVTIDADQGLCRLSSDQRAPHQPYLMVEADSCVFATEESEPLVKHDAYDVIETLEATGAWGELLSWSGTNNLRLRGEDIWRIDDRANMGGKTFGPADEGASAIGAGAFIDYAVDWDSRTALSLNKHDRTPGAYRLDVARAPLGPLDAAPGFSRSSLPKLFPAPQSPN